MHIRSVIHGGFEFFDRYAWHDQPQKDLVTLSSVVGESMTYHTAQKNVIDFPGEYDIGDCIIKGVKQKDTMSYIVKDPERTFALVTHKDALRHSFFDTAIDYRFVFDTKLQDYLVQLEKEGKIIIVAEEGVVA